MIKIYGISTCPDCAYLFEQIQGREDAYEFIEFTRDKDLVKEFLKIRDTESVFDPLRGTGKIGIPCFVMPDGTVTLTPEDAGLRGRKE